MERRKTDSREVLEVGFAAGAVGKERVRACRPGKHSHHGGQFGTVYRGSAPRELCSLLGRLQSAC